MHSKLRLIVCVCVSALVLTGLAEGAPSSERVVVIDMSESTPAILSLDRAELGAKLAQDLDNACQEHGGGDPIDARDRTLCLTPKSNLRWISKRGDLLHVYVFFSGGAAPTIRFTETSRASRLATDLQTLLKIGVAIGMQEAAGIPALSCSAKTYALLQTRSDLKVSVAQEKAAAPSEARRATEDFAPADKTAAPATDGADAKKGAEVTLKTGPEEHWFLTAVMPVRRLNELKFDSATSSFKNAKSPAQFYLSVDYALGDILNAPEHRSWRDNIVVKGMLRASKNPVESFGIGLGLRGKFLIDLDLVSPFLGYVVTRPDASAPADASGGSMQGTFQFGASFNLTEALAWLKGGS